MLLDEVTKILVPVNNFRLMIDNDLKQE